MQKASDFFEFMVCPHRQGEEGWTSADKGEESWTRADKREGVNFSRFAGKRAEGCTSADKGRSQFFAILCGRPHTKYELLRTI